MRLKKGTSKPRHSLYLDIYYRKGKRKREFLGICLEPHDDKTYWNEKLRLAENIKAKRMMELGVPEVWMEPLKAQGYTTTDKLKEVEKPGKLANDLNGYIKKNKLEIATVTVDDVAGWLG